MQQIGDNALNALERTTRVEIIDENGRAYVNMSCSDVTISVQDDGQTLKIFLKNTPKD